MLSDFQQDHLIKRLRLVHAAGLAAISVFFLLFYTLDMFTDLRTTGIQMTLVFMGLLLSLGYLSVVAAKKQLPTTPLVIFFLLNGATSILVWLSGSFRSPFVALYVILILITAQLYHYRYGLLQTVVAFGGLSFIYAATTNLLIPYNSLIPNSDVWALYQPPWLVLTYGCIYGILFIFASLSASSARVILFRPTSGGPSDATYQEQIVQKMPLGIFIVDQDLNIMSANPAAAANFPIRQQSKKLTEYLSLGKIQPKQTLERLASSGGEKQLLWKLDTGELTPITVSADIHESSNHKDASFILFVR